MKNECKKMCIGKGKKRYAEVCFDEKGHIKSSTTIGECKDGQPV